MIPVTPRTSAPRRDEDQRNGPGDKGRWRSSRSGADRRHASSAASMMLLSPDLQLAGKLDPIGVLQRQDRRTHLSEDVVSPRRSDAKRYAEASSSGTIGSPASGRSSHTARPVTRMAAPPPGRRSAPVHGWPREARSVLNIHPIRRICFDSSSRCVICEEEDPRIGIANQVRRRITVVADHRIRPVGVLIFTDADTRYLSP